jgi:hypothetical protein
VVPLSSNAVVPHHSLGGESDTLRSGGGGGALLLRSLAHWPDLATP